ncbi:MAG: pyridoxamine 5'-phosphate oxidase family protein [Chloroflexota bacterium]
MNPSPAVPPPGAARRLAQARNLWIATVGRDGQPHLVPVWFVFLHGSFYLCIAPKSVKAGNLRRDPRAALALEDGSSSLICHVTAKLQDGSPMPGLVAAFRRKYDWNLVTETEHTLVVEAIPQRWLAC